jgi:hypothetical protein
MANCNFCTLLTVCLGFDGCPHMNPVPEPESGESDQSAFSKRLQSEGYALFFQRGTWMYLRKDDVFFCLSPTGYERRTIVDNGRSPSTVEYFDYREGS